MSFYIKYLSFYGLQINSEAYILIGIFSQYFWFCETPDIQNENIFTFFETEFSSV